MKPIAFFIPGNPKGLKRHRSYTTRQGIHVNVDPSCEDKMDFLAKAMVHRPDEPSREPLALSLCCVFPRPKNHFRTGRHAGLLKSPSPYWYAGTPDLDNIVKFVGDAFNGIFWHDDRQLVRVSVSSVYGPRPGIHVHIYRPGGEDIHQTLVQTGDLPDCS